MAADLAAVRVKNAGLAFIWAAWAAGAGSCKAADVWTGRVASGGATGGCEAAGIKAAGTAGGAVVGGFEAGEVAAAEAASGAGGSRRRVSRRVSAVWRASSFPELADLGRPCEVRIPE